MESGSREPRRDIRRSRADIGLVAAFFATFAVLGLVAWGAFSGTGLIISATKDVLPISKVTPTPTTSAGSTGGVGGISVPITSTVVAGSSVVAATSVPEPMSTSPSGLAATKLRVAGTNGDGVYLRRTPGDTNRWVAWPDNTVVDYLNEDQQVNGRTYKKVRDPGGNVGWMPAEYLVPMQ
jgi:hypothetical protein